MMFLEVVRSSEELLDIVQVHNLHKEKDTQVAGSLLEQGRQHNGG